MLLLVVLGVGCWCAGSGTACSTDAMHIVYLGLTGYHEASVLNAAKEARLT